MEGKVCKQLVSQPFVSASGRLHQPSEKVPFGQPSPTVACMLQLVHIVVVMPCVEVQNHPVCAKKPQQNRGRCMRPKAMREWK